MSKQCTYRSVSGVAFNVIIQLQRATWNTVGRSRATTRLTLVITMAACLCQLIGVEVIRARFHTVILLCVRSALDAVPRCCSVKATITYFMTRPAFLHNKQTQADKLSTRQHQAYKHFVNKRHILVLCTPCLRVRTCHVQSWSFQTRGCNSQMCFPSAVTHISDSRNQAPVTTSKPWLSLHQYLLGNKY